MTPYKHLLVAVDLGPESSAVCTRAADIARGSGADLILIHVVEPLIVEPVYEVMPALPVELEPEQMEKSQRQLESLAASCGMGQSPCVVAAGSVTGEILQAAKDRRIDLIVMGSHGRRGVGRLLGSTASAVLHGATCDVLSVHIPA